LNDRGESLPRAGDAKSFHEEFKYVERFFADLIFTPLFLRKTSFMVPCKHTRVAQ